MQLVEQLANLVPDGLLRAARVQCVHEAELCVVPDDRLRLLLIRLQPTRERRKSSGIELTSHHTYKRYISVNV